MILLMVRSKSGINSPVEVGSLSDYLQGFSTIPGGDRWISEPSTVSLLYWLGPLFNLHSPLANSV